MPLPQREWSIILCSYHLESHPGKPLGKHLRGVSESATVIIKELQNYCSCISDPKFIAMSKILGMSHDVGKGTIFFQEYLHKIGKHGQFLKSHSTSSSLYGYYACKKILDDDFLAFATLMLIQGHHGGIPSPNSAVTRVHSHREELKQQVSSILHMEELDTILQTENLPAFSECKNIIRPVGELHKMKEAFDLTSKKTFSLRPYFQLNLLFSALIDADRMNAAEIEIQPRSSIDYTSIADFAGRVNKENKERLGDSNIIKLRNLVRDTVLSKVDTNRKIFSLTAPTGSGKTLTGLMFASMMRQRIFEESKRSPRIIYVLPFLSIIDQNATVIGNALGLKDNLQSSIMITHHHLAKLIYEDENNESYSTAKSQLLIEGWNSEIIVTTFVQFLETIIGSRASSLRKLHNLAGSIIILDEVQAINYEHWILVHDCLEFLANELDIRVILMTATQPLIFRRDEVSELFDIEHGFADRVELQIKLDDIPLDQFIEKSNEIINRNSDRNILIIMNTISSATSVFDMIKVADKDGKFFLSAGIVPYERRQRIKNISERLQEGKRTILVSTQVVEAGVDLDFDIVIRDLAPMDSIIQAAGRCNRNGKKPANQSPVYVFAVCNDQGNYFANGIYGTVLIQKTIETLEENEPKISKLADIYYQKVVEGGSKRKSNKILDAMKKLDYGCIDEEFKVIENEPTISIFVEANDEAANLWKQYHETIVEGSPFKLKEFFRTNRETFYSYVINARLTDPKIRSIPEEKGFYHIRASDIGDYYGYTGLKESPNIF